jgi:pyridoxal phosphate enzyme (YggS family)
MNFCETPFDSVIERVAAARRASGRADKVSLLAVSKTQSAAAVDALARFGQRAFGENYVQEALAKQRELAACGSTSSALEWHLIGPLQSNKCREVAAHFDWLQSLDRAKLIEPLARHRPTNRGPLNVLIQVNIDDEANKSGCAPAAIAALTASVATTPNLRLRGLMAIPAATPDLALRRDAFQRMRALFDALHATHAGIDTLSMGMSEDFELAIAEGATMVRVGTVLFGARCGNRRSGIGNSKSRAAASPTLLRLLAMLVGLGPTGRCCTNATDSRFPIRDTRHHRLHRRRQHGAQPGRRADSQWRARRFDRGRRAERRSSRRVGAQHGVDANYPNSIPESSYSPVGAAQPRQGFDRKVSRLRRSYN